MRRIGILTGGGDCPGLNAVIRSVVEKCIVEHIEVFGFYDGWRGVIQSDGKWMTLDDVEGIQTMGEMCIRDRRFIAEAGDAVYYDPQKPHGMVAVGNEPCEFLAIIVK